MTVIALAGNPNSGKTTLFNRLTGLNQKVGNYPGVTVERRTGKATIGGTSMQVVDLPGTYSLISRSRDEAIAFEVLSGHVDDPPGLTVLVLDASNLERNLYLALSVLELGVPAVVALNMMDLAERNGIRPDPAALSDALGVPVVPIVAKTAKGVDDLKAAIVQTLASEQTAPTRDWTLEAKEERAIQSVHEALNDERDGKHDGRAIWLLSTLATARQAETIGTPDDPLAGLADLKAAIDAAGTALDGLKTAFAARVIEARYRKAAAIMERSVTREPPTAPSKTDRIDAVLMHPVWGGLVFIGVMAVLFQSIFAWAEPLMGLIEDTVGWVQGALTSVLPAGPILDLLTDGVVGGVGNVIVFVPQIGILFLFIALLEDSGYLARAAYISDRFMAKIGLHGRAFVPLLSGFACAIPAVMATRAIEDRRDRLVTILVTPLISCSARLPVFTLIIASLFAANQPVAGVFTVGGLLMLAMYALSVVMTILAAFILKRTLLKSPTPPLVLELPPYRMPEPLSVFKRVVDRCKVFIKDAGTVILALSIVLWAMLYFPRNPELSFDPAVERAKVEAVYAKAAIVAKTDDAKETAETIRAEARDKLDRQIQAEQLAGSIAGRIGHGIEPLIAPLGYDWKIGVGLLASFAAREVFVSTMGLVYGVGDDADEESVSLRDKLRNEVHPETGQRVYTPLVGLSLMIFFLLAAQCMSTVAVVRRETASWRWPAFMVGYMTALAWIGAFIVYQGGRLLGFV